MEGAAPFVPILAVTPQKLTKQPEWAWGKYKYMCTLDNLLLINFGILECGQHRNGTVT